MNNSVPLEALTTAIDDLAAPLEKYVLVTHADHRHREFEYRWGLNPFEFDENHERNAIYMRKSMHALYRRNWCLIPTRETLAAMREMLTYNQRCAVTERKSFLEEFSEPEYEYIFLPWNTTEEIIVDGNRYSPPYDGFPRVKCSANPFFLAFHAQNQILLADHSLCPRDYRNAFARISASWHGGCPSWFSQEPDSSDPSDAMTLEDMSQWSDESEGPAPAPALPLPSLTPVTKQSRIANWVQSTANPKLHEPATEPLKSPLKAKRPRPDSKAAWRRDSVLGQRWTEQLFE
ncbi:hypothetical protein C8J56DRAFT_916406 [Mycena floridula]|nr:hypothetical protein C8J56DRAFT_916406 [Mycena floridula]